MVVGTGDSNDYTVYKRVRMNSVISVFREVPGGGGRRAGNLFPRGGVPLVRFSNLNRI